MESQWNSTSVTSSAKRKEKKKSYKKLSDTKILRRDATYTSRTSQHNGYRKTLKTFSEITARLKTSSLRLDSKITLLLLSVLKTWCLFTS
jgi:hypothetical protein